MALIEIVRNFRIELSPETKVIGNLILIKVHMLTFGRTINKRPWPSHIRS